MIDILNKSRNHTNTIFLNLMCNWHNDSPVHMGEKLRTEQRPSFIPFLHKKLVTNGNKYMLTVKGLFFCQKNNQISELF